MLLVILGNGIMDKQADRPGFDEAATFYDKALTMKQNSTMVAICLSDKQEQKNGLMTYQQTMQLIS